LKLLKLPESAGYGAGIPANEFIIYYLQAGLKKYNFPFNIILSYLFKLFKIMNFYNFLYYPSEGVPTEQTKCCNIKIFRSKFNRYDPALFKPRSQ